LFQIGHQQYLKSCIIAATIRVVMQQGHTLGDNTMAAALWDRLIHRVCEENLRYGHHPGGRATAHHTATFAEPD